MAPNHPDDLFDRLLQSVSPEHAQGMRTFTPPRTLEKWRQATNTGSRFVHYTSAENAMKIISERKIWMRSTLCMNDYSEVRHGVERLAAYMTSEAANPIWSAFDAAHPGLSDELRQTYDAWLSDLETQTFVTCVSEHDQREDGFGRLSMWRSYANSTGVAIVINGTAMMSISDALSAFSHPVLYLTDEELRRELDALVKGIATQSAFLATLERGVCLAYFLNTLHSLACSLKHPGFWEEREWRVVYRPNYAPSRRILNRLASVGGVPQRIYEIPLEDVPDEGLVGLTPASLINRVIIGPSTQPLTLYRAFVEILDHAGVSDAANKVRVSDMPMRA